MPWVRLDDHFDEHPKLARVGPLGLALWVTGLAYCNRNLTDGFIPWATARKMMSWEFLGVEDGDARGARLYEIGVTCGMAGDDVTTPFVIDLLLAAGLWEEVAGGYRVHDYDDYQPLRAQVEAERTHISEVRAEAGRKGGLRSGEVRRSKHEANDEANDEATSEANDKQNESPVPDPVPLNSDERSEVVLTPAPHGAQDSQTRPTSRQGRPVVREVYSAAFEDGWRAYPVKKGKHATWTKWQALVRHGEAVERLVAACRHFAEACRIEGREARFTMQAERFFGPGKHYLEFADGVPESTVASSGVGKVMGALARREARRMGESA